MIDRHLSFYRPTFLFNIVRISFCYTKNLEHKSRSDYRQVENNFYCISYYRAIHPPPQKRSRLFEEQSESEDERTSITIPIQTVPNNANVCMFGC